MLAKPDSPPSRRQRRAARSPGNDRVFPLGVVELQQFRLEHGTDIKKATLHVGPYANELARSFGAMALTIGSHIYFRDKAYNPASEEGRKTITHELTHIAQYEEGKLSENASWKELEEEAHLAEGREEYAEDPIVVLNVNGNRYRFSKSKEKYYASKLTEKIEEWVDEQRVIREEKEYLRLLVSYRKWREKRI